MAIGILILVVATFCTVTKVFQAPLNKKNDVAINVEVKRALHRADWKDGMPFWRRVIDLLSVEKNGDSYNVTFSAIFTDCDISSYPAFVFEDFLKHPRLEQAHMEIINNRKECAPFPGGPMMLCQMICQIPNVLDNSTVLCDEMKDTEV